MVPTIYILFCKQHLITIKQSNLLYFKRLSVGSSLMWLQDCDCSWPPRCGDWSLFGFNFSHLTTLFSKNILVSIKINFKTILCTLAQIFVLAQEVLLQHWFQPHPPPNQTLWMTVVITEHVVSFSAQRNVMHLCLCLRVSCFPAVCCVNDVLIIDLTAAEASCWVCVYGYFKLNLRCSVCARGFLFLCHHPLVLSRVEGDLQAG